MTNENAQRVFWERAACAALEGLLAQGEFVRGVVAEIAAEEADRLLEQWAERFSGTPLPPKPKARRGAKPE